MILEISGKIIRTGKSRNTGQNYISVLVPRADGQQDVVTIFTKGDHYKAGQDYKGKVDAFVRMCGEV